MSTMTPEERMDQAFGKNLGGTWRYSRMRTEITRVITEAEGDASADKLGECVQRAIMWLRTRRENMETLPWHKGDIDSECRSLEAAIRNPPAESEVRTALKSALHNADTPRPGSEAEAAIEKLRADRRLTREELDRPCSESDEAQSRLLGFYFCDPCHRRIRATLVLWNESSEPRCPGCCRLVARFDGSREDG